MTPGLRLHLILRLFPKLKPGAGQLLIFVVNTCIVLILFTVHHHCELALDYKHVYKWYESYECLICFLRTQPQKTGTSMQKHWFWRTQPFRCKSYRYRKYHAAATLLLKKKCFATCVWTQGNISLAASSNRELRQRRSDLIFGTFTVILSAPKDFKRQLHRYLKVLESQIKHKNSRRNTIMKFSFLSRWFLRISKSMSTPIPVYFSVKLCQPISVTIWWFIVY